MASLSQDWAKVKHNHRCDYGKHDLINDSEWCCHLIAVCWGIIKTCQCQTHPLRVNWLCWIDKHTICRYIANESLFQLYVGEVCLEFSGRISWFYGLWQILQPWARKTLFRAIGWSPKCMVVKLKSKLFCFDTEKGFLAHREMCM